MSQTDEHDESPKTSQDSDSGAFEDYLDSLNIDEAEPAIDLDNALIDHTQDPALTDIPDVLDEIDDVDDDIRNSELLDDIAAEAHDELLNLASIQITGEDGDDDLPDNEALDESEQQDAPDEQDAEDQDVAEILQWASQQLEQQTDTDEEHHYLDDDVAESDDGITSEALEGMGPDEDEPGTSDNTSAEDIDKLIAEILSRDTDTAPAEAKDFEPVVDYLNDYLSSSTDDSQPTDIQLNIENIELLWQELKNSWSSIIANPHLAEKIEELWSQLKNAGIGQLEAMEALSYANNEQSLEVLFSESATMDSVVDMDDSGAFNTDYADYHTAYDTDHLNDDNAVDSDNIYEYDSGVASETAANGNDEFDLSKYLSDDDTDNDIASAGISDSSTLLAEDDDSNYQDTLLNEVIGHTDALDAVSETDKNLQQLLASLGIVNTEQSTTGHTAQTDELSQAYESGDDEYRNTDDDYAYSAENNSAYGDDTGNDYAAYAETEHDGFDSDYDDEDSSVDAIINRYRQQVNAELNHDSARTQTTDAEPGAVETQRSKKAYSSSTHSRRSTPELAVKADADMPPKSTALITEQQQSESGAMPLVILMVVVCAGLLLWYFLSDNDKPRVTPVPTTVSNKKQSPSVAGTPPKPVAPAQVNNRTTPNETRTVLSETTRFESVTTPDRTDYRDSTPEFDATPVFTPRTQTGIATQTGIDDSSTDSAISDELRQLQMAVAKLESSKPEVKSDYSPAKEVTSPGTSLPTSDSPALKQLRQRVTEIESLIRRNSVQRETSQAELADSNRALQTQVKELTDRLARLELKIATDLDSVTEQKLRLSNLESRMYEIMSKPAPATSLDSERLVRLEALIAQGSASAPDGKVNLDRKRLSLLEEMIRKNTLDDADRATAEFKRLERLEERVAQLKSTLANGKELDRERLEQLENRIRKNTIANAENAEADREHLQRLERLIAKSQTADPADRKRLSRLEEQIKRNAADSEKTATSARTRLQRLENLISESNAGTSDGKSNLDRKRLSMLENLVRENAAERERLAARMALNSANTGMSDEQLNRLQRLEEKLDAQAASGATGTSNDTALYEARLARLEDIVRRHITHPQSGDGKSAQVMKDFDGYTIVLNGDVGKSGNATDLKQLTRREIIHKVVKGDTLWDIAKRYVNDPFLYPELARMSNIKNPHLIFPGNRIRIIVYTR